MPTVVVSGTGGNWSSTATWVGGALPAVGDDIVANATSGPLTVDSNRTCLTINFTNYTNATGFTISNGVTLTVSGTAITLGAGMTFTPGTTGILSTSNQAAITITFAGITIPNLNIGKTSTGGPTITISGTTPTVRNLVTFGTSAVILSGPALTITNSIVVNTTITSGSVMTFLGTVTMSGAGTLNTGFTVPALSTLIIGSNVFFSGNVTFASGSILTPGLFTVTITGGCTLDSSTVNWYNLNTTSNGHTITLTSDLNISNNLTWNNSSFSIVILAASGIRTVTVQGSVISTVVYDRYFLLNNIILNLVGRGTFAVARLGVSVGFTGVVNINTSDPVGYVIGSASFTGTNTMQLQSISLNLVGTSIASAFAGTSMILNAVTLDTNRSSVGGSNPIYTNITIDQGTSTFITDTTCTGNLIFLSTVSGVTLNGAKALFGGNLVGGAFNVLGTTTLEFTGNNPATWVSGSYRVNIIVNKSSGAVVTAGATISWGEINKTLTLNSTVNFASNLNTFTLNSSPNTINNSSVSQFFNMTIPNTAVLNINNNTTPILGTLSLLGSATFAGTHGWTCGTLTCSASNSTIILQSGVTYTTTTSVTMLGTNAARIVMRSNAPTATYAIWTLQNPATQSMVYVNAQGIDSNAGMTIYSFQGVILTSLPALNWYNGASQGTKAFTFVS